MREKGAIAIQSGKRSWILLFHLVLGPLSCCFSQWLLLFFLPFFLSFFLPCFSKYLLGAYCRPCARCWEYSHEQDHHGPSDLHISKQATMTHCGEWHSRGSVKWAEGKPSSHRLVPLLPDDWCNILPRPITNFPASELLIPFPKRFSNTDRAYKPKEQITRLSQMPSLFSVSLHVCVICVTNSVWASVLLMSGYESIRSWTQWTISFVLS